MFTPPMLPRPDGAPAVASKWDGVVHAENASIYEAGIEYLTIRFG